MKLSEIKPNPNNPRLVKDEKFKKLCNSIEQFPKMMELRPIIIDNDNIILGGNMRFKALKELKYKEVPDNWIKPANQLTEDEKRRFIIADNVGFGEWDYDLLANEWDENDLSDWGLELPVYDNIKYDANIFPETNYANITKEQIEKEVERLANQMLKDKKLKDVCCPECGHEFSIE